MLLGLQYDTRSMLLTAMHITYIARNLEQHPGDKNLELRAHHFTQRLWPHSGAVISYSITVNSSQQIWGHTYIGQ